MNTQEILTAYATTIQKNIELGCDAQDISIVIDEKMGYTLTDEQVRELESKIALLVEALKDEQAQAEREYIEMMADQEAYYASSRGCR